MHPCKSFQCFATASPISGNYQALEDQLMLPKGVVEVAASLRSLVKVWVALEREILVKIEENGHYRMVNKDEVVLV